jgi:hypothetical protein
MTNSVPRPFWLTVLVAWAALALMGAAWALATPVGGAPDDPAQLIKAAAVARGELLGTPATGGLRVTVPEYVAYSQAQACVAFHANTTAACGGHDASSGSKLVSAVTSAGLYNPLYYAVVGWPSRFFSSDGGIYAMRIVSDVVVTFFFALCFGMIALWRRSTLPLIGLATALTPMTIFLAANVNPNSLEIAATIAAFVGMLSLIREPRSDLVVLRAVIVFVSASVAANMRGLSLLWVAVAILVPLVLGNGAQLRALLRTRAIRGAIAGTAVLCVAAAAWLLSTNSLGQAPLTASAGVGAPGVGTPHLEGFAWNLGSTFYYGEQVVGLFGWLDTPSPIFVYFVWSLLVGALVVLGAILLCGRAFIFSGLLAAALLLFPPILQGIYITTGGIIWQGRYILPIFVCAMVGIAACLSDVLVLSSRVSARLIPLIAALWAAAQFFAFATTLKRYAVGAKLGWPAIFNPAWSPPGGLDATMIAFGLIVAASAVGMVVWARRRQVAESLA